MHRSLDRWIELLRGVARQGPPQLALFPEFALTGFPLLQWIDKACIEIPGLRPTLQREAQNADMDRR